MTKIHNPDFLEKLIESGELRQVQVPGDRKFPGYWVSKNGTVYSHLFRGASAKRKTWKRKKASINHHGGSLYYLMRDSNGSVFGLSVSHLVAHAFPELVEREYSEENRNVDYLNGDKSDCRAENLAWRKPSEIRKRDVDEEAVMKAMAEFYDNPVKGKKAAARKHGIGIFHFNQFLRGERKPEVFANFLKERGISKERFDYVVSKRELHERIYEMRFLRKMTYNRICEETGRDLGFLSRLLRGHIFKERLDEWKRLQKAS